MLQFYCMLYRRRQFICRIAGFLPVLGFGYFNNNPFFASSGKSKDVLLTFEHKSISGDMVQLKNELNYVYGAEVDNYINFQLHTGMLKSYKKIIKNDCIFSSFSFSDKTSMEVFTSEIAKISNIAHLVQMRQLNKVQFRKIIS